MALALTAGCSPPGEPTPPRLIDQLAHAVELPVPQPDRTLMHAVRTPGAPDGGAYLIPFDVEPGRVILLRARLPLDAGEPALELKALLPEEMAGLAGPQLWRGEVPGKSLGACIRAEPPGVDAVDCQRLAALPPRTRRGLVAIRGGFVEELTVLEAQLADGRAPESPLLARLIKRAPGKTSTGQSWRSSLVGQPGDKYRFLVRLPEAPELWLGAGHEWGEDEAPLRFVVEQDGRRVFDQEIPPDGAWHDQRLELSGRRGQISELVLETTAVPGAAGKARGLWSDPRVFGRSALPNVLLVTLDAVRPDHTSAYGYGRDTTPALAQLTKLGTTFDRAVAQAGSTWDSIPSVLSGLYPAHDRIRDLGVALPPDLELLPDLLSRAGYDTFAGSDLALFPGGYLNGFDAAEQAYLVANGKVSPVEQLRGLSAQFAHRPTFAWFHIEQAHYPLLPREASRYDPEYRGRFQQGFTTEDHDHVVSVATLTAAERRHLAALYDAAVHEADEQLKGLLTVLNESGHWERTVVVVTADHGERIAEHGAVLEHSSPYDDVLHVPLVIEWEGHIPGGQRVSPRAALVDIVPTVLDLAGLRVPPALDGRSLVGELLGKPLPEQPVYSEVFRLFSQYRGDEHLIVNEADVPTDPSAVPPCELYDLAVDPEERHNLARSQSPRAAEAARSLAARIREWQAAETGGTSIGQGAVDALRQAGYLPRSAP